MNGDHQQSAAAKKADRHFRLEREATEKVAAWTEHHASQAAVLAKTERLKALRLAQDAALPTVVVKPKRKSASRTPSN